MLCHYGGKMEQTLNTRLGKALNKYFSIFFQ